MESEGRFFATGTYRIWLRKPNYARVEVTRPGKKEPGGILVGDGDYFWSYWPGWKDRGRVVRLRWRQDQGRGGEAGCVSVAAAFDNQTPRIPDEIKRPTTPRGA